MGNPTLLATLKKEYAKGVALAKKSLRSDGFACIDSNGELKLKKEDALDVPSSTKKLKKMIEDRMGLVRIEEILADVDREHSFSTFFVPPEGYEQKKPLDHQVLYAVLIAMGTNLGLVDMANSTVGISLETLKHVAQWCVRPEVITEANNFLVKQHSLHPLARLYGNFTLSGSDGDRFCIQKSSNLASYYPKAFGYYQKVISIYTHLSDQYSVFSTQVISCGVSEAAYVLGGLLNNQQITHPHFHCTDTGGFTHHLFALCYLLGFSFQSRLKDLADHKLYKFDKEEVHKGIDTLFNDSIDIENITEQWE